MRNKYLGSKNQTSNTSYLHRRSKSYIILCKFFKSQPVIVTLGPSGRRGASESRDMTFEVSRRFRWYRMVPGHRTGYYDVTLTNHPPTEHHPPSPDSEFDPAIIDACSFRKAAHHPKERTWSLLHESAVTMRHMKSLSRSMTAAAVFLMANDLSSLSSVRAWVSPARPRRPAGRRSQPFQPLQERQSDQGTTQSSPEIKASQRPSFQQSLYAQPSVSRKEHSSAQPQQDTQRQRPQRFRQQRSFQSDSKIMTVHMERVQTAGRVGSKYFVDPCKLFVGNLDYTLTEQDVVKFLNEHIGGHLPPAIWLHHATVVREWKTGQSKGYAFVQTTEPHFATTAILYAHGKELLGRSITVKQGKRKDATPPVYVVKKNKPAQNEEEAAILDGLQQAQEEEEPHMDPEQIAVLRQLDPDLLPNYVLRQDKLETEKEMQKKRSVTEDDSVGDDTEMFGDEFADEDLDDELDLSDEEFEYEEVQDDNEAVDASASAMNRAQRRKAARENRKKKRQSKGFGQSQ